ncbi:MAG: hypothetical protein R3E12_01010 [Candidatus Eisenbacteria bacterium]
MIRWTGRSVVLKTGPWSDLIHEAAVLSSLPPGVSARCLDLLRDAGDSGTLVQEHLPGTTLANLVASTPTESIPGSFAPRLLIQVAALLLRVHRLGLVHTDIKPSNLLLTDPAEPSTVRLLDFGHAFSESSGFRTGAKPIGGTAGFVAPELTRGWRVDGRADQYSLGRTLSTLSPDLASDSRWQEILGTMTSPSPSSRFPDLETCAQEVIERFGLVDLDGGYPVLGGGPVHGREEVLNEVERWTTAQEDSRLLVISSRPGSGLSRFLAEARLVLSSTSIQVAELGAEDLGALNEERVQTLLADLDSKVREGCRIILGLGDWSPALDGMERLGLRPLRLWIRSHHPRLLALPPLESFDVSEMLAVATGEKLSDVEAIAHRLWQVADGDLRVLRQGFDQWVRQRGRCVGVRWSITEESDTDWIWDPTPTSPGWDAVPSETRPTLSLLAAAGEGIPWDGARRLVAALAGSAAFDAAAGEGWIRADRARRVRWLSQRLLREAKAASTETLAAEAWLNAHFEPAADDIGDLLRAARWARRVGDREREAQLLDSALQWALANESRSTIGAIVSYPDPPPTRWTKELIHDRITRIRELTKSPPTRDELRILLGRALRIEGDPAGIALLEEVAADPASSSCSTALWYLSYYYRTSQKREDQERVWESLLARTAAGQGPPAGYLELGNARLALTNGNSIDARRHLSDAITSLRQSGPTLAVEALFLEANLTTETDPGRAEQACKEALELSQESSTRAMAFFGLAQIYELTGRVAEFVSATEAAVEVVRTAGIQRHLVRCRIQRAWAWGLADQRDRATAEVTALLPHSLVREEAPRRASLLGAAAFLSIHRGDQDSAISQAAVAWELAATSSTMLRGVLLRYLTDVILDGPDWTAVDHLPLMPGRRTQNETNPALRIAFARWQALVEMRAGRFYAACEALAGARHLLTGRHDRLEQARFLHHQAVAQAMLPDREAAESAAGKYEAAIQSLGSFGYGYYRCRSILGLATTLHRLDRTEEAAGTCGA